MLPREVRGRFFQKRVFHFELTVPALQFPDPLGVRRVRRQRLPGKLLPVILHPEPESGIVNTDFPRHLGNWQRVLGHLPGGLLLKLRSVSFRFSRHSIPFLSGEDPIGSPVRKLWGTSIVAMFSVRPCPPSWLAALRPGGRLVFVIADTQLVVCADKRPDGGASGQVSPYSAGFMHARTSAALDPDPGPQPAMTAGAS